ncbi:DUF6461 domain-containing protein [Streptomyces uncialis]
MTTRPTDYRWFEERFPELAESYCITLVHAVPPSELLLRLGTRAEPSRTGIPELVEAAYDFCPPSGGTRSLMGVTGIGAWSLVIEPNGWHGVDEQKALPASLATRWVSHYSSVNNSGMFFWAESTELRLQFSLADASRRKGSHLDEHLNTIRRLGFEFPEEVVPSDYLDTDLTTPAASPSPSTSRRSASHQRISGTRASPAAASTTPD